MSWEMKYPFLGKLLDGFRLLGNLLAVNMLWLLTSLPVFTAGAASSAAYAVLLRYVREGDVPILKTYFHSLKENFWQATSLWLISLGLCVVCYVDWRFAGTMQGPVQTVYLALSIILCIVILVLLTIAMPIQAYYRNTLRNIIKNAFLMAFGGLGWTLAVWAVWCVYALYFLLTPPNVILTLGSLLLMWGFSFPAWLASKFTLRLFRVFDPTLKKLEDPDEWSESKEEG